MTTNAGSTGEPVTEEQVEQVRSQAEEALAAVNELIERLRESG